MVVVAIEYRLTAIAPLRYMMRDPFDHHPRQTRHETTL